MNKDELVALVMMGNAIELTVPEMKDYEKTLDEINERFKSITGKDFKDAKVCCLKDMLLKFKAWRRYEVVKNPYESIHKAIEEKDNLALLREVEKHNIPFYLDFYSEKIKGFKQLIEPNTILLAEGTLAYTYNCYKAGYRDYKAILRDIRKYLHSIPEVKKGLEEDMIDFMFKSLGV